MLPGEPILPGLEVSPPSLHIPPWPHLRTDFLHAEASHAALAPWQGQNALDGFVAAYQMTGLYRQQLMATDRIHHVIKNTDNLVTNVIPDRVESEWGVRGTNR